MVGVGVDPFLETEPDQQLASPVAGGALGNVEDLAGADGHVVDDTHVWEEVEALEGVFAHRVGGIGLVEGDVKLHEAAALFHCVAADDLAAYTRELADDRLQGRGPAGPGETPTLEYLQAAYERIGLRPVPASLPLPPPGSPLRATACYGCYRCRPGAGGGQAIEWLW